jgi:DnaJ family protein C protein 11
VGGPRGALEGWGQWPQLTEIPTELCRRVEMGLMHVGLGASREWDESTRGGWTVLLTPVGILWKLSVSRNGQKFVFPVVLTPRVTTPRIITALVVPPAVVLAVRLLLLKPYARRRRLTLRAKHAAAAAAAADKAAADVRMMATAVQRARGKQLLLNGLVIVKARFGAVDSRGYAAVAAHPPPEQAGDAGRARQGEQQQQQQGEQEQRRVSAHPSMGQSCGARVDT